MIKGTIKTIHPVEQIQDGKYQKQIFAISNNDGYEGREQIFAFELFGDKCDLLNGYKEGDEVSVDYNLECRHWKEDRYFTTLKAWRIGKAVTEYQKPVEKEAQPMSAPPIPQDDGLPF